MTILASKYPLRSTKRSTLMLFLQQITISIKTDKAINNQLKCVHAAGS